MAATGTENKIANEVVAEPTQNTASTSGDPSLNHGGNEDHQNDSAVKMETMEVEKKPASFCFCCTAQTRRRCINFYWNNEFLILIVLVILLAKLYPPLGAQYLAPDITATWLAVVFIFFLAGLELKTQEFRSAIVKQWHFNAFLQIYNFGVVSAIVYGITRGLESIGILSGSLAKGMVICGCLPLTISMVVVLTKAGNGDEAAAVFNSAFGNLLGVFVSPILILGYLGVDTNLDLWDVFYKLMLRVLVPIVVGQVVQKSVPAVVQFVQAHKPWFKQLQQYLLVFIVYTVFCETFQDDNENDDTSVQDIFIMIAFQFLLLTFLMVLAWYVMKFLFPNSPKLRVMGVFGCTHKTVAMGIPMINAIYEDSADIGLYTLPLLIWHPMQLLLGTFLAPRLAEFVKREEDRLGITSSLPTATTSSGTIVHHNANEHPATDSIETEIVAEQRNGEETSGIPKDGNESDIHVKGQSPEV